MTILSTPLTKIVTPPNDDDARFPRIAEKIGLRRAKKEGATITLIHQFIVTRANNKSSGMGANPFRTQSITLFMNRRIVQSTPRIQIDDLEKRCRLRFDGNKAQELKEDYRNKDDVNG